MHCRRTEQQLYDELISQLEAKQDDLQVSCVDALRDVADAVAKGATEFAYNGVL